MSASSRTVARFVTVTMGLVIGLTFLFGFGNVLNLALKLQVPAFVAPLVAPAVDLTVLGLLVGTRQLALSGASEEVLRPARRLLLAASVVTLLLNVADPVFAGQWGKAAFDSVGPLLLIGVCEAGPGLLRALSVTNTDLGYDPLPTPSSVDPANGRAKETPGAVTLQCEQYVEVPSRRWVDDLDEKLVQRARQADADHWQRFRRPISAETLRKQLRVGSRTSRALVALVRPANVPAGTRGQAVARR
ncbi:hypothetical protein G3I59_31995 [Amycolatopsis rubida]|uniref:DUF2637 domain-containing protein n=1 Tax=Amycolatopsis rubida TaxID=112413 RepID=A0ABX0BSL2_9PSEU|nr:MULTISPECIES: hypothetical protein [Amycolatopsis]MYW92377.1 hypothetical protein [Amycolatopsis rubida]MYW95096.1 hypothetical protein [Amycolatopsis rubida]NEC57365.1 hypothetical protein [Amycolatopsis rubida]NEC60083.1 hypothetical protein [Amycolatopsis rubida]OAP24967.1 hypothetical protein A4R44_04035 [Amycolatopsis sp. M39]